MRAWGLSALYTILVTRVYSQSDQCYLSGYESPTDTKWRAILADLSPNPNSPKARRGGPYHPHAPRIDNAPQRPSMAQRLLTGACKFAVSVLGETRGIQEGIQMAVRQMRHQAGSGMANFNIDHEASQRAWQDS